MGKISIPGPKLALLGAVLVGLGVVVWFGSRDNGLEGKHAAPEERTQQAGKVGDGMVHHAGSLGDKSVRHARESTAPRPPLPFRSRSARNDGLPSVLAVLENGDKPLKERVGELQGMRGTVFSEEQRERAMEFLTGQDWPVDMAAGDAHWLADELLTALRMQEPPWDGLAAELAEVAFQSGADPVIRDYIMQHLGHLWEQYGAREEIETALWKALETADETTPGTALIALSRGYQRDERTKSLMRVRDRALELAQDPATPLASRVTALAIAGESGGTAARKLSEGLLKDPKTPLILRKVAENALAR